MQKYFPVLQYINVPNLITTLGMAFGIAACYFVTLKDFKAVIACLFLATSMDLLDGFFANKLNQGTRFGQYVDSLNDFFVCCVIPTLVVFTFFETNPFTFAGLIFYCACGLWRLAHFDVLLAENSSYFTGFPVPSGLGFTMCACWVTLKFGTPEWVCICVFFFSGLSMISFVQLKKYGLWQKMLAIGGILFITAVLILPLT